MAFSSHIVTVNRLKTLIDGLIGKKSNLPNTSKTITENIADLVFGVKGSAESTYRKGNINITPANLGLGNVNNTADADKLVLSAQSLRGINIQNFNIAADPGSYTMDLYFTISDTANRKLQITQSGISYQVFNNDTQTWTTLWTK